MFRFPLFRHFLVVSFLSLLLIGCGGSKDAVSEDELVTDTGVTEEQAPQEQTPAEEPKSEETPVQQEQPQQQPAQEQPAQQEGVSKDQLQSDLDAIKADNEKLKEENSSLQQSNKELTTKISDLEAANAALSRSSKKNDAAPVKAVNRPAPAGRSTSEEVKAYEAAVDLAKARKFREAMSEMQTLLNTGIKEDYADNCHYWLGECSFQLKDYAAAIPHFQVVLGYKFSEKKDDAQLMIAQSYERLGDKAKAKAEYQKLVEQYPTSEYVKRAKAKLN